jgi:twitching motility protein PilI
MAAHPTPHAPLATPPVAQWLALEAGAARYLVAPGQAGEIFAWTGVQPTPHTRAWFLGVANLRGRLCGVVDLALFLAGGDACSAGPCAECQLLSLHPALGVDCALRVHRLHGMRSAGDFVQAEAGPAHATAWLGQRLRDADGQLWQALDLQLLAHAPAFLAIDA